MSSNSMSRSQALCSLVSTIRYMLVRGRGYRKSDAKQGKEAHEEVVEHVCKAGADAVDRSLALVQVHNLLGLLAVPAT